MLNTEQLQKLGMNPDFDKSILPEQYQYVHEPYYKGDGELGVKSMQMLINSYKEYVHQQAIIKQELLKHILKKEQLYPNPNWSVYDVVEQFPDSTLEQQQAILSKALNNEATAEQIKFSIREFAELLYELKPTEDEED